MNDSSCAPSDPVARTSVRAGMVYGMLAIFVGLWVASGVDCCGQFPGWREGPGLTIDEGFNVDVGVRLADALLNGDFPELARRSGELPDHPPLGRLWLGLTHELGLAVVKPQPIASTYFIPVARIGSAVAFAGMLFLTGVLGRQLGGFWCGLWGMVLLAGTPRVLGHAHIASLETVTSLAWMAVVAHVARYWNDSSPAPDRAALGSGLLWGLALLTKVQGVLLPAPLILWSLWRWKRGAVRPLALAAVAGGMVFFLGWPWLWEAPVGHVARYLGRAADRPVTLVWYFGQAWADRDVPWHYPWVILLATTPILVLATAVWGTVRGLKNPEQRPLVAWVGLTVLTPLLLFTIPGVAVYDGERLFGVIFPALAVLGGLGLSHFVAILPAERVRVALGTTLVAVQSIATTALAGPHLLDQYNLLVGGPYGAQRLGLARTYWGDALTRSVLARIAEQVPHGATVDAVPVLHPFQLPVLWSQTPALIAAETQLRAYDPKANGPCDYLMIVFRDDYLEPPFRRDPPPGKALVEVRHRGVLLAGLYDLRGAGNNPE